MTATAEQRDGGALPGFGRGAEAGAAHGRLWASAFARLGPSSPVAQAVRCVCTGCGAHSYRVVAADGGADQCSVCDRYGLVPLEGLRERERAVG